MSRSHRIIQTQCPIHITARSLNREPFPIALEAVWEILCRYLHLAHHGFQLEIHAFVLMPNHFHLIARDVNGNLPKCMAHFMRESSKEIAFAAGRINRCWGTRFHSSVITSPIHYLHAYKYVYRNPVAGGLVSSPFDYRFSTLPYLVGRQRELIPMFEDFTLFNHLESSIGWLEAAYDEEDAKRIKKAVRRKKFGYAIDRRTHAEISLRDTPPK